MGIKTLIACMILTQVIYSTVLRAQDVSSAPYETDAGNQSDTSMFRAFGFAVSPFAILPGKYSKLRLRFQASTHRYFAVCADLRVFIGKAYPGYQFSPLIKFHPGKTTSRGLYLYGAYFVGQNKGLPEETESYYMHAGPGFGFGLYKGIDVIGSLYYDLGMGYRYIQTESGITPDNVDQDYEDYFIIGPGSLLELTIQIGYRF